MQRKKKDEKEAEWKCNVSHKKCMHGATAAAAAFLVRSDRRCLIGVEFYF